MSHISQNLEKIIQMISIEQLLGLVKQNTDNKSNSDIMNLPIVQKVVKAYEDEIQVLQTPSSSSSSSLEKDYSGDIAKINEQLASINNNLLQLTEAIRNINFTAKEVKREELVNKSLEAARSLEAERNLEEEHVRLKIEEKQEDISAAAAVEVISKAEESVEEESEEEEIEEESSVAEETEEVLSVAEIEEEVVSLEEETEEESSVAEESEESEKEISDEESVAASLEEESETAEEVASSNVVVEEEEEVFEIEIDDVTYYATSEENGILYEVDADGEVGKKVGIIKDGEPIFI